MLLSSDCVGAGLHCVRKFSNIIRTVVRERVAFEVTPAVLVWVEFGRIGRQEFHMQAWMLGDVRADLLAAMGVESIPNEEYVAAHMAKNVPQELDHLLLTNRLVRMKVQIPPQTPPLGRDRDRADNRDVSMMSRPRFQDRRLSARCPGALHERGQENACFVDENEGTPTGTGLFLMRFQSRAIQSP